MKTRISILGVVVGGIVDIVATNALNIPVIFLWVMPKISGMTGAQVGAIIKHEVATDLSLRSLTFVIGCLCSILGGYVAARIAKRSEVLNGALAAWLCVLIGIWGLTGTSDGHRLSLEMVFIPLSIALSALGGWLRGRSVPRKN